MSNILIIVPFYDAVASLYPFGHTYKAHKVDLWAYIFFFWVSPSIIISTVPIFLLGYARIKFYFMLQIDPNPFGFGQVSTIYNTLKSAKLNMKILV
jgi:hypothetical protein